MKNWGQIKEKQAGDGSDDEFEVDSLFDSTSPVRGDFPILSNDTVTIRHSLDTTVAQRTLPPIPGLFFDPSILISEGLAADLAEHTKGYFGTESGPGSVNQVMLFGRASDKGSGLPLFLDELILALSSLLKAYLPEQTHALLFPTEISPSASASRQAILNHYTPGEGITPHVDLLTRFADGIVAVSLESGTVMTFRRVTEDGCGDVIGEEDRWDVYLPERSVLVLTGDARYKWSHGIEGRLEDCIRHEDNTCWIDRGTRVSITIRWLLPGADVVGETDSYH